MRGLFRFYSRISVLLFITCLAAYAQVQSPAPWKPDITLAVAAYPYTFVGYGDMRSTNPADIQHSNATVRRAEIARIAQEQPAFVLISGDLVLRGSDPQDWKVFDSETAPLRQQDIPLFPALGNHDVAGPEGVALSNFFQRFPTLHGRRWYSVNAGNLLIFVLDSTSPDGPASLQWDWLQQGLESVPADVDFVLLLLHHPPVTHSSDTVMGGGHSARASEQRLRSLLERLQRGLRPRIVVLAGHVHNYERYEEGGVTYIVSGGGGATPYMVRRSDSDLYRDPGPSYHICNFTVDQGELRFQMLKLTFDGARPRWNVRDSFVLRPKPLQAEAVR